MDDKEKKIIESIKSALNEEGAKTLIEDIEAHKEASDTISVIPVVDTKTGQVLSSTTDELLKRQGYVMALNWVLGIMRHYQTFDFTEESDDI